jgi:sulfonate transport system permease protein
MHARLLSDPLGGTPQGAGGLAASTAADSDAVDLSYDADAVEAPVTPLGGPATIGVGRRRLQWLGIVVPLALLALWGAATNWHWVPSQILPTPMAVLQSFAHLVATGDLQANLLVSLMRVAVGFGLGAVAGVALGAVMGLFPAADRFLRPTFLIISQVPVLGWLPFLMMVLGIGEALKIVIIAKAALTPVTLNTLNGFRAVPKGYLEVGEVYGFGPGQRLRKIMLPAALPPVCTGLRYGLTHAWLALVVVELLASTEGVGYLMVWGRQLFQLDVMMAMIVVIGVVGFAMDKILALAEAALMRRHGGAAR